VTLTFLGKESEHLEKLHVHEAPKIMLYPAVILAGLCVVWGFAEPWLGSFMRAGGEMSLLGSFFNLETPIFFAILVPTGLIIYLTYYKKSQFMGKIRSNSNPLTTVLKRGYFFDDLYERVIANGMISFSKGVRTVEVVLFNWIPIIVATSTISFSKGVRTVEVVLFNWIPIIVATSVISLANAVHKYLDVLADELLSIIAHRTLRSASRMKNIPQTSLQHYISAALLGFILILILIILTIGV
jgi:NADH:ubiquinone oxidoreductase subunit 5 (subunit L)/multisubunit Na+/H+ antiporter MnhA subunit